MKHHIQTIILFPFKIFPQFPNRDWDRRQGSRRCCQLVWFGKPVIISLVISFKRLPCPEITVCFLVYRLMVFPYSMRLKALGKDDFCLACPPHTLQNRVPRTTTPPVQRGVPPYLLSWGMATTNHTNPTPAKPYEGRKRNARLTLSPGFAHGPPSKDIAIALCCNSKCLSTT